MKREARTNHSVSVGTIRVLVTREIATGVLFDDHRAESTGVSCSSSENGMTNVYH